MSKAYQSTFTGETNTPYSKQFVHSKSSQYRRLRTEWKNNVYLARSRIQGLGLYAAKDLEKHTMVIEYIGTIIRNEVANRREKIYEEQVLCDGWGLLWCRVHSLPRSLGTGLNSGGSWKTVQGGRRQEKLGRSCQLSMLPSLLVNLGSSSSTVFLEPRYLHVSDKQRACD